MCIPLQFGKIGTRKQNQSTPKWIKNKDNLVKNKIQKIYFQIYSSEERNGEKPKSNIIFKLPVLPYGMKG